MAEIILVTGGSRSGKSSYAQKKAEEIPGARLFIATCPIIDPEMEERIRKHREAREGRGWKTIEETVNLAGVIRRSGEGRTVLVDCLTLWINNLMYKEEKVGAVVTEEIIVEYCWELVAACRESAGTVFLVANEVGMGIVPDNETARRYRDIAGRCNQEIARAADKVILLVCGIPLPVKEQP
ncbi:MAG: bifunctional adenosylcobinamide kinase/adenosylcobinamide-phosphate guanylyltransferase [Syntrophales bacterium]